MKPFPEDFIQKVPRHTGQRKNSDGTVEWRDAANV
jgi:hypothetical protein